MKSIFITSGQYYKELSIINTIKKSLLKKGVLALNIEISYEVNVIHIKVNNNSSSDEIFKKLLADRTITKYCEFTFVENSVLILNIQRKFALPIGLYGIYFIIKAIYMILYFEPIKHYIIYFIILLCELIKNQ